MTIRSRRAGRARHFQNPRAIVRAYPTPYSEEELMRTARKIDSADDLVAWIKDAGYRTRGTSGGGTLVYGPVGTATVPSRWDFGRGRKNVLSALRAAGLDLSPLDGDEAQHAADDRVPTPADVAKLVLPNRPRPTLAYTKTTDAPAEPEPTPEEPTVPAVEAPRPEVTLADLYELSDQLDAALRRVATVEDELARLRAEVAAGRPVTEKEQAETARRESILTVLRQLPPGFRLPAGAITANLGIEEDAELRAYRKTITDLVAAGDLVQHGGNPGGRGGGHAQYSLAAEPTSAAS